MASEKLSVSFDPDLAATIRGAAAEEGVSVSQWLAGAAEAKARRRRLREALDAFAAEHGALSEEEIDQIIHAAHSEPTGDERGAA